jgi:peptide/nickel transport system permease protein
VKLAYILQRIVQAAVILFVIITLNFCLVRGMPGDPMLNILGESDYHLLLANAPDTLEELRAYYGLEKSLLDQYWTYLKGTSRLNFGYSFHVGRPVTEIVFYHAKWSFLLVFPAILIAAPLGGRLGLRAGWKPGGKFDAVMTPIFLFINSIPSNCLAIVLLMVLAYKARLFPLSGMVSGGNLTGMSRILSIIWHMVLPVSMLTAYRTASNFLLMKSTVSQIRQEEYITTAFSKGLLQHEVLNRHVLINALPPFITAICMQFGYIISGAMFVEVVFSWRGMGSLIYASVGSKDYPILQFCFLLISFCVILSNMLADILYVIIDPRIKGWGEHE